MSNGFKIDLGDAGRVRIVQNANDIINGEKLGVNGPDYSRMSAYIGKDQGLHFGSNSPSIGRHNTPDPFKK